MDCGSGHLTVIVGTEGGAFAKESSRRAEHLNTFFQCPGFSRGMLVAGIDLHLIAISTNY